MRNIGLGLVLVSIIGCRGVSTIHDYPEGRGLKSLSNSEEVYLTKASSAPNCTITKVADVRVSSKTYGGAAQVNAALRKLARKKGGNAVINYNFWIAPNGFSWAAPQCEGTVVAADLSCLKKHTTSVDNSSEK